MRNPRSSNNKKLSSHKCPGCSRPRWKPVIKGKEYRCRNCGHVNVVKEADNG